MKIKIETARPTKIQKAIGILLIENSFEVPKNKPFSKLKLIDPNKVVITLIITRGNQQNKYQNPAKKA